MRSVESPRQLEDAIGPLRHGGIAFVPTMGALHEGHAALIRRAKELAPTTVVSIFVNPLQFGDPQDLARYPRTLTEDAKLAEQLGVDVLWIPTHDDIYPPGLDVTLIDPSKLGAEYEGAVRPGHFAGVLTVVSRLFDVVKPNFAVFGEKDRQQLELVRRMALRREASGAVEVIGVPTVREADGLALSSRNRFLSPSDRERALGISRAIAAAQRVGDSGVAAVESEVAGQLKDLAVEYSVLLDEGWERVDRDFAGNALLLIAAKVGSVHLIDNGIVRVRSESGFNEPGTRG